MDATTADSELSPPRRGWRILSLRTLLLACLLVWGVNRFPHEVGYWLLASAQNAAVAGDISLADHRVEQAAWWIPRSPLPWQVQSQVHLQAQQYDSALKAITQAITLQPGSTDLQLRRYWILMAGKNTAELQTEIDRLAKLGKEEIWIRVTLARLLAVRGDLEKALEIINQISYNKDDAEFVSLTKSRILKASKRYEAALLACDAAVQLTGEPLALADERIQLLLHLQRFEEAMKLLHLSEKKTFDKVWNLFGKSPLSLNQFAYFRAVANQELDVAESQVEEAMKLSSERQYAVLDTRGYVYYRRGKFTEGLTDLNEAIAMLEMQLAPAQEVPNSETFARATYLSILFGVEANESNAVIYYHRALLHQALGHTAEAERDLERVQSFGFEPGDQLF